jgi:hypothetical protein
MTNLLAVVAPNVGVLGGPVSLELLGGLWEGFLVRQAPKGCRLFKLLLGGPGTKVLDLDTLPDCLLAPGLRLAPVLAGGLPDEVT